VLSALVDSRQRDSILAHNRYSLNGHVLYPYCPIAKAIKMDSSNYDPSPVDAALSAGAVSGR
jgi:hypothetical protein